MIRYIRRSVGVSGLPPGIAERLLGDLEKAGFSPFLLSIRRFVAERAGVGLDSTIFDIDPDAGVRRPSIYTRYQARRRGEGDVFLCGKGALAYLIIRRGEKGRTSFHLGVAAHDEGAESILSSLRENLRNSLGQLAGRQLRLRWKDPAASPDPRFATLSEGQRPDRIKKASSAAHVLSSADIRRQVIKLKSTRGILLNDMRDDPAMADVVAGIDDLLSAELLEKHYVLVCGRRGNVISHFQDISQYERVIEVNPRCSCGALYSEERLDEEIAVSAMCRALLDKSRWMTVLLVDTLLELGIPASLISINYESEGDEIDVFASIVGNLAQFELTDGEFSHGHAYKMTAKIVRYQPQLAITVSTGRVDDQARRFLSAPGSEVKILHIEGLEKLKAELEGLMSELNRAALLIPLRQLLPRASFDLPSVAIQNL